MLPVPQGVRVPRDPQIPCLWAVLSCPFKTSKKHWPKKMKKKKGCSRFFVLWRRPHAPTDRFCRPVSLVSRTPRMHCVCALVRMAGAGCSAVLGSFSLLFRSLSSRWDPEGQVLTSHRGRGLCLTPFARRWVLAGVDVVWMLSCVLWSLF